jgi:hypothetical protein
MKTGFDQIRDSADVIDVDVSQHEGLDAIEWKIDLRRRFPFGIGTLERPAIDQYRRRGVQVELMARAGDT